MWIDSLRAWLTASWLIMLVAILGALWGAASNLVVIAITVIWLALLTVVFLLAQRPKPTMSEAIRGVVTRGRE